MALPLPRLPLPTDNWPRSVGYIRVSRDTQWEKGLSIETQDGGIRDYCQKHKIFLLEICSDHMSGGRQDRPGLNKALSLLKPGMIFIVADLDRLCRDNEKANDIYYMCKKNNIKIRSLSPDIDWMTPDGEMMYMVLCSMHQRLRETTRDKIKANLARVNREGKLRRKPPFGYKMIHKRKDFTPDPDQQNTLREIIRMHNEGINPCRISYELNRLNNTSLGEFRSGPQKGEIKKFHPATITRILQDNGLIVGKIPRKSINERIICHRRDKLDIDAPNPSE